MIPRLPRGLTHPVAIGNGAFASVYRARQEGIDRWVAVKIIHEKDRERRKGLLQEAKVQAQIHLGCIPHVYDAFAWGRNVCIIMEWIKGVPLSTLLATPLTSDERFFLATRFVEAVAGLHALNFAHRDLKPENVLVTPECALYLVDFGFSKHITDGHTSLALIAKGTPAYMAPEVWEKGAQIDLIRADVYSAGKVLFEILGETTGYDTVKQCLQALPDARLASGVALLEAWRSSHLGGRTMHECRITAAKTLAAELLADRLVYAARQLLYAHRTSEAYWLLVEALEENPEHGEAVRLMADFSRFSHKQRLGTGVRWSAAAVVALMVSLGAFFAGRQSSARNPIATPVLVRSDDARLVAPAVRKSGTPEACVLKDEQLPANGLNGMLIVANPPPQGTLLVNGKDIADRERVSAGLELPYGRHTVAWRDANNRIRWKERVTLLPFEKKTILVATGAP